MEMKSTRELWGGVDGICDHGEFEKWHYYKGTYLRNGGRFRLLVWDGISLRSVHVLYQELFHCQE